MSLRKELSELEQEIASKKEELRKLCFVANDLRQELTDNLVEKILALPNHKEGLSRLPLASLEKVYRWCTGIELKTIDDLDNFKEKQESRTPTFAKALAESKEFASQVW